MSALATERSVSERKRLFRALVALGEGQVPGLTDGCSHSRDFILSVLGRVVDEAGDLTQATELMDVGHELTSTRLGAAALIIAEKILQKEELAKPFIDAEIVEGRLVYHFDKKAKGYEKLAERMLSQYGEVELLAVPGDEIFEGVVSNDFIFTLVPTGEVVESVEVAEDDDEDYDEDDVDDTADPEDDEDEDGDDEDADEDADDDGDALDMEGTEIPGYLVAPFELDVEAVEDALAEAELEDTDLDELFELCFFGPDADEIEEAKKKPPKMKLKKRARLAAKRVKVPAKDMRTRMLRAMAQKGFMVHGTYKKKGQPALIRKWQKFKKKGAAAAVRSLRKGGGVSPALVKAAQKAAKAESTRMAALPTMSEEEQDVFIERILDDLGLLDEEATYLVAPFEMTDTHYSLAGNVFTDDEVDALYGIAFEDVEEDEEIDPGDDVSIDEKKPPKMKLKKRARLAGKNVKVPAKDMRTMMLRAMAQKGFLVHGKYKKKGVPGLIRKWQKFKKKGATAAVRSLRKGGVSAALVKAARKSAKAKK